MRGDYTQLFVEPSPLHHAVETAWSLLNGTTQLRIMPAEKSMELHMLCNTCRNATPWYIYILSKFSNALVYTVFHREGLQQYQ